MFITRRVIGAAWITQRRGVVRTNGPLRVFFNLAVDDKNEPTYPIATVDGTEDVTIVLLVSARSTELESHAQALRTEGHEVVEATSFEQARALLSSLRPDLLVTSIQLGAYNGLHLVWQRHVEQPGRPSIVTSAYPDTVLESEAAKLGCPFLIAPIDSAELADVARSLLRGDATDADDKRRWPRTRIGPELSLDMDQGPATMIDVSYGGCRLRFHQGADLSIASPLNLPIPTSEVPITGRPVWRESALDGDVFGVAIAGATEAEGAWRSFVDRLTSRV